MNSGNFNERLRKAVKLGKKHVKQCPVSYSSFLILHACNHPLLSCTTHIQLCSQKGFICEVCNSDQVIYPFEIGDTYQVRREGSNPYIKRKKLGFKYFSLPFLQCPECNALFHLSCKPSSKIHCPKCLRLEERRRANSINHDLEP